MQGGVQYRKTLPMGPLFDIVGRDEAEAFLSQYETIVEVRASNQSKPLDSQYQASEGDEGRSGIHPERIVDYDRTAVIWVLSRSAFAHHSHGAE